MRIIAVENGGKTVLYTGSKFSEEKFIERMNSSEKETPIIIP